MRLPALPPANRLAGKRVLLRLDLNVPMRQGRIMDDSKLKAALPTIKTLRQSSPLVIVSHLGEPKPKTSYQFFSELSLAPIMRYLKRRLGGRIVLASGSWAELRRQADSLAAGDIMVLENLRFWKGETRNSLAFARELSTVGDAYVNDAFAVSHRKHASVVAVTKFLPGYAGPLLAEEVRQLERVGRGRKPLVMILGGAKVSGKLLIIKKFLASSQALLLGGGSANTLLKVQGHEIGASYYEAVPTSQLKQLRGSKVSLPVDAIVTSGKSSKASVKVIDEIGKQDVIIDIGPKTIARYIEQIHGARTIFWNGPVGRFEKKAAQQGTNMLLRALAQATRNGALSVIGGGETAAAAQQFGYARKLTWVSTGGGASLAFLAGEAMPGLQSLTR